MTANSNNTGITIRRLGDEDALAVAELAALDSGVVPEAPLLGAEIEGRMLAAVSLRDGRAIADPFSRTAELRSLLELRAEQLRERVHPRVSGRLLRWPTRARGAEQAEAGKALSLHPRPS